MRKNSNVTCEKGLRFIEAIPSTWYFRIALCARASLSVGKQVTHWTVWVKKFSHASQFSIRRMKKMRLQPASLRLKMLSLLTWGVGAIPRDVASGGGFWTTFSQRTF